MFPSFDTIRNLALLGFGFGFVVFWHELGHFLAAKWAGVKVEQFAVGFGQALFSWRKGIGIRLGNTQKDYYAKLEQHLRAKRAATAPETKPVSASDDVTPVESDAKPAVAQAGELTEERSDELTDLEVARASAELGLGETEYRLNWIPLGGYVKMLGQDDLKPNADADDPRAFNRQPISKRMVIVSAGVIMNVILAAIGFTILFLIGFGVPPAIVGTVTPGSPAQEAGLLPGDEIVTIDGKEQHDDWTKVQLNAALCSENEETPITVRRDVKGTPTLIDLKIKPRHGGIAKDFLGFGIAPPSDLRAPTAKELKEGGETPEDVKLQSQVLLPSMMAVETGEVITAVAGQPVDASKSGAFLVLDAAMQASKGKPVTVTVKDERGSTHDVAIEPEFAELFGSDPLNFAGMVPRMRIMQVPKDSQSLGKILPGDVITEIRTTVGAGSDQKNPSVRAFRQFVNDATKNDGEISVTVLRNGQSVTIDHLRGKKIDREGNAGLKIAPGYDEAHPVVADLLADSAAKKAGLPVGSTITSIAGLPVSNWYDVETNLRKWLAEHAGAAVPLTYKTEADESHDGSLALSADEAATINSYRYRWNLNLIQAKHIRKTSSPFVAAGWGVVETRDFILQFYLTLRRMVTGNVSAKSMMGPLGIFQAGETFAQKGNDWLVWFLAMISANLAVVNFLPIPIVDGGLFTFLIMEKIKGKPLSPRTQAIAQYVGLAMLLGVFLFVTWQDAFNFQFRMR